MNWTSRPLRALLWLAYLLVLLELFAFVVTRYVPKFNQFFYTGAALSESEYVEYLDIRDPVLGWPKRQAGIDTNEVAERGLAPRVARKLDSHCVSAYGDSFTYSDEVDGEDSWPAVASRLLGCDVLNFGIGGYGTDQSYLRYRENASHDGAPLVVLNHMSENIARVRNQYRGFLYVNNLRGFKPVFVLDGDNLAHVGVPEFDSYADYLHAMADPTESIFPHDAYRPGAGIANFRLRFPYSLALANALHKHYRVPTMVSDIPMYEFHYRDTGDMEIVLRIMSTFVVEVEKRGQTPLVSLIPYCADFEYLLSHGQFPYKPLIDAMQERGIDYFDFGEAIRQRADFSDFHEWYGPYCGGHPNRQGYRVMAEVFAEHLQHEGHIR